MPRAATRHPARHHRAQGHLREAGGGVPRAAIGRAARVGGAGRRALRPRRLGAAADRPGQRGTEQLEHGAGGCIALHGFRLLPRGGGGRADVRAVRDADAPVGRGGAAQFGYQGGAVGRGEFQGVGFHERDRQERSDI